MKNVPLGQICEINPRKIAKINPELQCSFIPMEYIDDQFGVVTKQAIRQIKEVEKGYSFFQNKDILFAKITPCMENGKCAIAKNLINGIGFGSTEFHVIRVKNDVIPDWVYYNLRQTSTRKDAEMCMTGSAGQKRVPGSFLEDMSIPLPPLPEQKRIAAILEKADRLRRQRQYALELSGTYLQSVFLEMFGDPVTNPKGWDFTHLGSKIEFITSGSRGWAQYYANKGAIFLRIQNVRRNQLILDDLAYVQVPNTIEGRRTRVKSGDLLLSITADLGRTAVIPPNFPEAYINQHLALLRLKDIDPVFVAGFISTPGGKAQISQLDREGVKSGLNFDDIRGLQVFVPPPALQQKYTQIVQKYERLRSQQREAERQAEHLFQTLLHKAFQGELSLDEDEALLQDVEVANPPPPAFADVVEPIDKDTYQLALPIE